MIRRDFHRIKLEVRRIDDGHARGSGDKYSNPQGERRSSMVSRCSTYLRFEDCRGNFVLKRQYNPVGKHYVCPIRLERKWNQSQLDLQDRCAE